MIGSTIDKYEVMGKLGEGGMATVYLAKHLTLGRVVAIKVLHPYLSASTRNRMRFAREARAIEHLDHGNILQIYDYSGSDAEDCFIVTEFVNGHTLGELLRDRGMLPSELAALIGLHLSNALAYAHRSGIIHRDLKPDNVMVREDGQIKLMDFGIARFLDESTVTMTGALIGSPAYMSPEQALERSVDSRSDLFSLGSLLFHLVTGRLPFPGPNPSIILRNIIEGRRPEVLELQPGVSPSLADCIERLMQTNPEARFEDASQVADALREVLIEVDIDPEEGGRRTLATYLQDADDWESELQAHLEVVLLDRGRDAFAQGKYLDAQRLFNRLLAWNPEHPEVLELLSSFQYPDLDPLGPAPEQSQRWAWIGAGVTLLVAGVAWWLLGPTAKLPAEPPSVPSVASQADELPESDGGEQLPATVDPVQVTDPASSDPRPMLRTPEPPRANLQPRPLPVLEVLTLPEEPPVLPTAFLRVSLDSPTWGDVYLDGDLVLSDLRQPKVIETTAGEHSVLVKNPMSTEYRETFSVGGGETYQVRASISELRMTLLLDGFSPICEVRWAGAPVGSVEDLDGTLSIKAPRQATTLALSCPEGSESFQIQGAPGDTKTLTPR